MSPQQRELGRAGGREVCTQLMGSPRAFLGFVLCLWLFFIFHWFSLFSSSNPPAIHTAPARRGSARAQGAEISGGGFHDPGSEDPTPGEPAARCY